MSNNHALFQRALRRMPGGVNSPVRAFKSVGGEPFFTQRADGAYLWDADGQRYIDYVGSWGPMIAGHNHPHVREAVERAVRDGLSFGTPCAAEVTMAETIARLVPSMDMMRMVNSGTEATMAAIRVARGFTGRDKVVKFEGCYHGHGDAFLVKAGSGALTFGVPTSPGVPKALADLTLTLPYNDADAARELFAQAGDDIACVIIEPIAGNMNCIPPRAGYLALLRELCTQHGALLIFDEVMTGFRVARGGVQEREGIVPDLTTLGKVIGGGLPVGAFGGREAIMSELAPDGAVYQAGTLSGNPLAMAAGIATLRAIQNEATLYDRLSVLSKLLCDGLHEVFAKHGVPHYSTYAGSMLCTFFTEGPVENLESAMKSDTAFYGKFFHAMLDRGVYLAPSQFETAFVSSAHTTREIERTIAAADDA
ncbi:MAG TPA: glutamate-1-semialdehyde 2,1-aminomutase [Rudaea sp.]